MADLLTNFPSGVMRLYNTLIIEKGTFRLKFFVRDGDTPQNWAGWSNDFSAITTMSGATLTTLSVSFGPTDGSVTIEGIIADASIVDRTANPQGMNAIISCRIKDSNNKALYLIAPSKIRILNAPEGAT